METTVPDILPVQAQRLTLAEPERQGDDPARAVAELGRFHKEAPNLFDRVRLDVLFFEARSLGDLSSVGDDVPAPHSLAPSVTDDGGATTAPKAEDQTDDTEHGRGLSLVGVIAHRIVVHDSDGGRTVTAELFTNAGRGEHLR
ncbi:hypothetical protein ACIPSA_24300 [Streptomyces sp. NPDC086549]|uniref:hypothetical protein n=1 Tax=Streptomyces sp. NPDC086549 TaxID=3365752 RepID=UPI00383075D7